MKKQLRLYIVHGIVCDLTLCLCPKFCRMQATDQVQRKSFITKLASIGNLPADTDEMMLHKKFLIFMGVLMSGGGVMWGSIAAYFGLYWQSTIPFAYAAMTAINLSAFALWKNFGAVRFFQVLISLLLPFFFQWSLGGFNVTGAMMLWSLLALVGSITFQSTGTASRWLIAYVVFTIISGFMDEYVQEYSIRTSPGLQSAFFVINIVVISSIVVGLMLFFVHSRDQANKTLTKLKENLEVVVEERTRELQETLAHLNAIIDNIGDGLLVTDENARITRMNPALARMYELTDRKDLLGRQSEALDSNITLLLKQTILNHEPCVVELELPGSRTGKAISTCIMHEAGDGKKGECLGSVTLIHDITREKEIDSMKTDFISNVSHELRTPLTSVLGFAKIIQKKFTDNIIPLIAGKDAKTDKASTQILENIKIIVAEGERLTTLINSVLDISKMEAGKTEWNMADLDLKEVVDRAITATSALFEGKNVILKNEIQSALPMVVADRDRLIQVVINLISNSVKFSPEGSITIRGTTDAGMLKLSVTDTGIGIKKEDLEKVFDKFQQVGDTLTDKPQGTGLGLPICRQIIEHHKGRIWVESELGKGSTFSFMLPLKEASTAAHASDTARPVDMKQLLQILNEHVELHKSDTGDLSGKKTILVTDDDPNIRRLLSSELGEAGFHVLLAENGMDAISILKSTKVDLVILDIMMPKISGFDVAAVIKNDPKTMDIPIMIHSIVDDRERGLRIGVDRYIPKTGDMSLILKEASALLRQGHSNKHVLVLDESESTVQALVEVLQAKGYQATGAYTGEEGLRLARESKPDMVIVDAKFSEKHDLVKTLKFEKGLENLYFVILGQQ